ncbi:MAG TPA: hypothetical protein PK264_01820 [Hyphomicrobiaceae bacterium]|nr:hypothetical protein [Hyphomicrobiaceae bacterium]
MGDAMFTNVPKTKIHYLLENPLPQAIAGHGGKVQTFANLVAIDRSVLRYRLKNNDERLYGSEELERIARAHKFPPDWPEWTDHRRSIRSFVKRYERECGPSPWAHNRDWVQLELEVRQGARDTVLFHLNCSTEIIPTDGNEEFSFAVTVKRGMVDYDLGVAWTDREWTDLNLGAATIERKTTSVNRPRWQINTTERKIGMISTPDGFCPLSTVTDTKVTATFTVEVKDLLVTPVLSGERSSAEKLTNAKKKFIARLAAEDLLDDNEVVTLCVDRRDIKARSTSRSGA